MRAMMEAAGIKGTMKMKLWSEAANYMTQIENILVNQKHTDCPSKLYYGETPWWVNELKKI